MKKIVTLTFFVFLALLAQGQNLTVNYATCNPCNGNNPQYGALTPFTTNQIVSDYGMRIADPPATRYHMGIDYAGPAGGSGIASVEGGTVSGIFNPRRENNGIVSYNKPKYIVIEGDHIFAYLHIFSNGNTYPMRSGGFVLATTNFGSLAIINLATGVAICANANEIVAYNGVQYTTENLVEASQLIAPLGISGATAYHLHLSCMESGTDHTSITESIDPWNYVDNFANDISISNNVLSGRIRTRETLNFNTNNCEHYDATNDDWGTIVPRYNNNTRNVIEVEVSMPEAVMGTPADRYTNVIMNEDRIDIQITNLLDNNYQNIIGSTYNSYFQIDPEGGNTIYPSRMRAPGQGLYGGMGLEEMGCLPFAYRSNSTHFNMGTGHPHDYYLFPDFHLRIANNHQIGTGVSLANYPWNSRYRDGIYNIRSQITTIRGVVSTQDPINLQIDNFKPFILNVEVVFENIKTKIYSTSWSPDPITASPSRLQLNTIIEEGLPDLNPGPLTIYAITSENLPLLTAQIPSLTAEEAIGELIEASTNKWKLVFNNVSGLEYGQCHKIIFSGQDYSGNELLDFQIESTNPQAPTGCNKGITKRVVVPKRNGDDSWDANTASGQDEVHRFRILECGGFKEINTDAKNNIQCEQLAQSVLSHDVHYTSSSQSSDGSIVLTLIGTIGTSITWYDATHLQIGDGRDLSNLSPGWYCYELKNDCCIASDCIEVGACNLALNKTLEHPFISTPGIISVTPTNGVEPYEYQWSTGAITSSISNLTAGNYTVTISDDVNCSLIESFTLINCPIITVTPNIILNLPSSCNSNDGGIKVLDRSATGGTPPYSWHVENEAGDIIILDPFTGLAADKYYFIATDANGCTGYYLANLLPEHYPVITVDIAPSCSGQEIGYIDVTAIDPLLEKYNFYWDNEYYNEDDLHSNIGSLAAGDYCVTIISVATPECELVRCYEVPIATGSTPLQVSSNYVNPCEGSNNGSINLVITGGIAPYEVDWSDLNFNELPSRTGLAKGLYHVTVTDYCGATVVKNFFLRPIEIKAISAVSGCAGQGQAMVTPEGGNLPYSYLWSNNAAMSSIGGLKTENYCVTVTDAQGCHIQDCVNLQNKEYTVEKTGPCVGFENGFATIQILNPKNDPVIIFFNGFEYIPSNPNGTIIEINFSHLSKDTNYPLSVQIGSCSYSEIIRLQAHQVNYVYSHYESDEFSCIHDLWCNGDLIAENASSTPAVFDVNNASSGLFTCKTPILCNGHQVDYKHFEQKTVTIVQYLAVLDWAYNHSNLPFEYINALKAKAKSKKACRLVTYCTADLEITFSHPGIWSNNSTFLHDPNNPGCYLLFCGGNIPTYFCVEDISPEWFLPAEPQAECVARSKNLYQLIVWENQLKLLYPSTFINSDLYIFWINVYRNDPRAKCVDIVFCENDFSILVPPDINAVDCDDNINLSCFEPFPDDLGDEDELDFFVCYSPSDTPICIWQDQQICYHGHWVDIYTTFPGNFLDLMPNEDEEITKFVSYPGGDCYAKRFGTVKYEGSRAPKDIIECGGISKIVDTDYSSLQDDLNNEIPDLEFFFADWDAEHTVYIRKLVSGQNYALEYKSSVLDWTRLMNASSVINISYFDKQGETYLIGGEFQGALSIDGNVIATEVTKCGFTLQVDYTGQIIDYNVIKSMDPVHKLIFLQGNTGLRVIGHSSNQSVSVNGNTYPVSANSLVDVLIQDGVNTQARNINLSDASFSLERVAKSSGDASMGLTTYLLKKTGSPVGDQIMLLTKDQLGNTIWTQKFSLNSTDARHYDIKYTAEGNLIVALTFNGVINLEGTLVTSSGGSDIILLCYNNDGILQSYLNYGSEGNENISELFISDNMIYFKGEFGGTNATQIIGRHNFILTSNSSINPYVSFVLDSDLLSIQNKPVIITKQDNAKLEQKVTVFPNPVNNEFVVTMAGPFSDKYHVKIFDMMGKLIRDSNIEDMKKYNEIHISNLKGIPSGVYIVEVLIASEPIFHTKIVKE